MLKNISNLNTASCRCMSTPSGEWTWTTSFGGVLKVRPISSSCPTGHKNFADSTGVAFSVLVIAVLPYFPSQLRNANNVRMAKYQRKPFSFRPAKRTLEVEEEALPYLDAIIIGWIVVSRDIEVDRAAGSGFFPFG